MALPVEIATGTYTGTGAAQTLTLGFVPSFMVIVNETDGDVVNLKFSGSSDATHTKIDTAAAAVATNGITFVTSASAAGTVTIGSDTSISENAKVFRYIAVGGK